MHFDEDVETVILETADCHAGDLNGAIEKRGRFNVPKQLREAGISEAGFEDVENAITTSIPMVGPP